MPKTVTIQESIIINAPIEAVWNVSATNFKDIDQWDGNVKKSDATEGRNGEAPVSGRICQMYNGSKTVERLVSFDVARHNFAYDIVEGLPGFVTHARNRWTHEPLSEGKTKLTMLLEMQVKGVLGTLMQIPMKSQMAKVLVRAQEELKHFVETGHPHLRKQKKLKRA